MPALGAGGADPRTQAARRDQMLSCLANADFACSWSDVVLRAMIADPVR
jgi:hypothetical protein